MGWKDELRLSDLDPETALELTCKRCGHTHYENAHGIGEKHPGLCRVTLDEVERGLRCSCRFCRGPVRLSLIHDDKTEGFVGGMA